MKSPIISSVFSFCISFSLLMPSGLAQTISKKNYIKYLPLCFPQIMRQLTASDSAHFDLYGQNLRPFIDEEPKDGFHDLRYNRLKEICDRFSPILFKNTPYSIPMDFKVFTNELTPLLYIDEWDLLKGTKMIGEETINFTPVDFSNSTNQSNVIKDDEKLKRLIEEFHPDSSRLKSFFKVLYFDFPGQDQKSWKKEYHNVFSNDLPYKYKKFSKIYAHPFIHTVKSIEGETQGYEFVIQYWFFYPFNAGGNNHEGDWEHINVVITIEDEPRRIDRSLKSYINRARISKELREQFKEKRIELSLEGTVDIITPNKKWSTDDARKEKFVIEKRGYDLLIVYQESAPEKILFPLHIREFLIDYSPLDTVKSALMKLGIKLSKEAKISSGEYENEWKIIDKKQGYTIIEEKDGLTVFEGKPKDFIVKDAALSEQEIQSILKTKNDSIDVSGLFIKRVEYYFHHFVMILDYMNPYVYDLPLWHAQVESRHEEKLYENFKWWLIRHKAHNARGITHITRGQINTHPLCYIGGEHEGPLQLLALPGGKNRDSHGTYPFPGIYKNIGPHGAAEGIRGNWDEHENLNNNDAEPNVLKYSSDQIEIIPDWEVLKGSLLIDSELGRKLRRKWSWLILPIRWGFPASESLGAGLVDHADAGNLSPVGPAYNSSWNQVGPTRDYFLYEPHILDSGIRLGLQGTFLNNLGFLNILKPVFLLPGFNVIAYIFKGNSATFETIEPIIFRQYGNAISTSFYSGNNAFARLLPGEENKQIKQFMQTQGLAQDFFSFKNLRSFGNFLFHSDYYMGKNFASETTLRYSKSKVRYGFRNLNSFNEVSERRELFVQGNLAIWEWWGSLRYNLFTAKFQPYIKAGTGWSWYRIENIEIGETLLDQSATKWFHTRPMPWLPNTVYWRIGIEFLPIFRSNGDDLGIRLEYEINRHRLGKDAPENLFVERRYINLALTFSK